ncbi:MAG: diacylglycerol kinase family protein, partial [Candidatus Nanopelagicales bacterium]|nr:diacylglycerol kinase family protein [Candidatus Nanopelagicales bacterium]
MRAMLIVNPNATAIRRGVGELLATAIADHARVEVVPTEDRGHATDLAAGAREDGIDLVVAFGGDGTINETVQGLLGDPDVKNGNPVPRFAAIPGGYGNTFARNLGFPLGVRGSARRLSEALSQDRIRTVGLGLAKAPSPLTPAGDRYRWICFSAGLGIDAEIIRTIDRIRSKGRRINGLAYV